jgi:hypothetical protein
MFQKNVQEQLSKTKTLKTNSAALHYLLLHITTG